MERRFERPGRASRGVVALLGVVAQSGVLAAVHMCLLPRFPDCTVAQHQGVRGMQIPRMRLSQAVSFSERAVTHDQL